MGLVGIAFSCELFLAVRGDPWRPNRRIVMILLKTEYAGFYESQTFVPGVLPFFLGKRWRTFQHFAIARRWNSAASYCG